MGYQGIHLDTIYIIIILFFIFIFLAIYSGDSYLFDDSETDSDSDTKDGVYSGDSFILPKATSEHQVATSESRDTVETTFSCGGQDEGQTDENIGKNLNSLRKHSLNSGDFQ